MNRAEAVNWLINIMSEIGKAEHRDLWCYEQALSEIREMIEHECEKCVFRPFKQFQPKPHWIPCSERLPEKEGIYIVTDDAGGMATVSTDEFSHYEDGEPMWMFSQNVTAWMPLPEPHKEGEQDE